jgi:hypothetical protein
VLLQLMSRVLTLLSQLTVTAIAVAGSARLVIMILILTAVAVAATARAFPAYTVMSVYDAT